MVNNYILETVNLVYSVELNLIALFVISPSIVVAPEEN